MLNEPRQRKPSLREMVSGSLDDICMKYRQACQAAGEPPQMEAFLLLSAPQNLTELRVRLQSIEREFRSATSSPAQSERS